jgi:ubiquitin carboxyl-terminal hydrolase 12/46
VWAAPCCCWSQNSKLEKALHDSGLAAETGPGRVGVFGLENVRAASHACPLTVLSCSANLTPAPVVGHVLPQYENTCYCNSVLQALYFCKPFRERVSGYRAKWLADGEKVRRPLLCPCAAAQHVRWLDRRHCVLRRTQESADDETLLTCLRDLFNQMTSHKKRVGTIGPKNFVRKLKEENIMFRGLTQQDAHEFLNYTINEISDLLRRDDERAAKLVKDGQLPPTDGLVEPTPPVSGDAEAAARKRRTWVHDVFGGVLTNETRCLTCECITRRYARPRILFRASPLGLIGGLLSNGMPSVLHVRRDEDFLDLSVELTPNSSITHCLKSFSAWETLSGANKFHCDTCGSLQEAQKCMRLKSLPNVLVLHLKRFKFIEQAGVFRKVNYRVAFPKELRLPNASDKAQNAERRYRLSAVVVHMGSRPNQGHYLAVIHSHDLWLLFDDEKVNTIDEEAIATCFGVSHDAMTNTETVSVATELRYQAVKQPAKQV